MLLVRDPDQSIRSPAASARVSPIRNRESTCPVAMSSRSTESGVVTHRAPPMQCGHSGIAPTEISRMRRVIGSTEVIRVAPRPWPTQMRPPQLARPVGYAPTRTVATRTPGPGRIFMTVPSLQLVTQTNPSDRRTSNGTAPTFTRRSRPEPSEIRRLRRAVACTRPRARLRLCADRPTDARCARPGPTQRQSLPRRH